MSAISEGMTAAATFQAFASDSSWLRSDGSVAGLSSGSSPYWKPARARIARAVPRSASPLTDAEISIAASGCSGANDPNGSCNTTSVSPTVPVTCNGSPLLSTAYGWSTTPPLAVVNSSTVAVTALPR